MISIITPFHNCLELIPAYESAVKGAEVIVIDNASDPPLPNAWRLNHNVEFSAASNIGLRMARTDAVLFLNNDVVALERGWLEPIREALEPGVLVGPQLRYDEHGSVGGIELPYLDGWCLAGMTQDLLAIGGWDEGYREPSYFGDNDLSFRARLNGMELVEQPAPIGHLASRTSGGTEGPGVAEAMRWNHQRFVALVEYELGLTV